VPEGIMISFKLLQYVKALPSTIVRLFGRDMLMRLLHPPNAPYFIIETPSGMTILVSAMHLAKAFS
jgi:hypothetical protein